MAQHKRIRRHYNCHAKPPTETLKAQLLSLGKIVKKWGIRKYELIGLEGLNAILVTGLFITTIMFAHSTIELKGGMSRNRLSLNANTGLALLRVLQGATSFYVSLLVSQSLEGVQWALTARDGGSRLLTVLGLAPSTSTLGLANYFFNTNTRHSEKSLAANRIFMTLVVMPLAGAALFVNLSTVPIYKAQSDFNVTAGVGAFNSSLVSPFLEKVNGTVSHWILASTYGYIDNPKFSVSSRPVNCTETENMTDCESYFFPAGLQTMIPNPDESDPSPFVVIHNALAMQLEFQTSTNSNHTIDGKYCNTYGNSLSSVGLELCVSSDDLHQTLKLDAFLCSKGVSNGKCRDTEQQLNISLTTTAYTRRATVIAVRRNSSIVSVSQLSKPQRVVFSDQDVMALNAALGWLFNYTAAGIPPTTSLASQLWNQIPGSSKHDWILNSSQTLKSTLSFILTFFTMNNYGNVYWSEPLAAQSARGYLPIDFEATASIATSYTGFIVDRRMFIVYIILQSLPLIFSWVVVIWFMRTRVSRPRASSFPLTDFRYKVKLTGDGFISEEGMRSDRKIIEDLKDAVAEDITT